MNHHNFTITITTLTLGTISFEEFVAHEKWKMGNVDEARERPRFDAIDYRQKRHPHRAGVEWRIVVARGKG